MADLICIGEAVIDFTPGIEKHSYVYHAGGAPANVAVAASRLGSSSAFCGKVGDDHFGVHFNSVLHEAGVAVLCPAPSREACTTLVFVHLDGAGERSFTFARKPGADMFLTPADLDIRALEPAKIVHAGSCSLSREPARGTTLWALKAAKEIGKLVSFDLNYRAPMWENEETALVFTRQALPLVDLLKVSEEELAFLGGEDDLTALIGDEGVAAVVVTMGKKGARCLTRYCDFTIPAAGCPVADTTCAGDAFWSAFLTRLLRAGVTGRAELNEPLLREAVRWGNAAGRLCVQKPGGMPALPGLRELARELGEED